MSIDTNNFWDSRDNLKNKPSVSLRTGKVIEYLMKKSDISMGIAIEKLMLDDGLYNQLVDDLCTYHVDIKSEGDETCRGVGV